MVDDPQEIVLELPRELRSDNGELKAGLNEIKAEIQAVRGHMLAIQTDVQTSILAKPT